MALHLFRDRRNSFFTIVLFGLLILSFVFWGAFEQAPDQSATALTTVNGEEIPYREFNMEVNQRLRSYGQMFGGQQNMNKQLEQLVKRQVAAQLVTRKLMAQEARELGVIVGKPDLIAHLKDFEAFQDPKLKRFSPSRYQQLLESQGIRPKFYESTVMEGMAAQRLRQIIENSVFASEPALSNYRQVESFELDLSTAQISLDQLEKEGKLRIADEEIKKHYDTHNAEYLSSEKRRLQVAHLNTFDFQNKIVVSEDEIKEFYDSRVRDSSDPKWSQTRARALHILISDQSSKGQKQINRIAADLRKGETGNAEELERFFRSIARDKSEDYATSYKGGDLGFFDKEKMVEAFNTAVFDKAKLGEVYGPVKTDFGYHLILVMDRSSEATSLANRRGEIRYEIKKEKKESQIQGIRNEIKTAYQGTTSDDLAKLESMGLEVIETSPIPANEQNPALPFVVVQAAFEGQPMVWQDPQEFEDNLYLARTTEILAPEPMSFADARDRIVQRLRREKAETIVDEIAEKLKGGKMPWSELKSYGAELALHEDQAIYRLQEVPGLGASEVLKRAMFRLSPENSLEGPVFNQGRWVFLRGSGFSNIDSEAEGSESSTAEEDLKSAMQADILDAYIKQLYDNADIPQAFRKEFQL